MALGKGQTEEALPPGMGLFSKKLKDPVCGMTVEDGKQAATAEHKGKTYSFCSASCAAKFKANPGQYTA